MDGLGGKLGNPGGKGGKGGSGILGKLALLTSIGLPTLAGNEIANAIEGEDRPWWWAIERGFTAPGRIADHIFGNERGDTSPIGTNAATGTPGLDALGADFLTGTTAASKGPENGLQVNTIAVKRAIESRFPNVPSIGGYRKDPLKWHPNGLALDVMIPGGSTRGGRNPEGKRYGDQIWAWLQANGPAMGVDLSASLWQTDQGGDHYDHIHVATTGGGYPSGAVGASGAATPPPTPARGPLVGGAGANQKPQYGPPATPPPAPPRSAPPVGPLEELLGKVPKYDTGGPWPPGTLGMNTSGKPEFVLNPQDIEYLKSQGIDPNSLQHGSAGGALPGPKALPGLQRTEGYIPAAAGNTDPVGQGGLSNFLDLGESFFHNLIDSGAQLGSMAVSAAAAAGSFGAGAAAGPAASAGIQMAAEAGKRGVSYLYDLGGIWGEALVEQVFPFGAPRWLGSANPMAFMPQGIPGQEKKAPGTMGAAKTAIQSWAQPGNPAMANMGTGSQGAQAALGAVRQQPSYGQTPAKVPATTQPQQATPQFNPMDPSTWLPHSGVFDNGGVLQPNSIAMNLSKTPEYVFTQQQLAMSTCSGPTVTASFGPTSRC
ncbi:hypothetical protein KXD97_00325 [Mycobacterium sp. SMC-8]|uniref:hypothetical protein n=1 Tax=Mycobacterium sp. SMC-8 TaxID=2857060 RepID=UPI0021B369B2|nr:hypothetical protein [Mycobacterium sp. SMC-8]UXA12403.1 hypothetical protein KXD97_00325 [Mycobacterium sp. SMC-8]